jgi:hypothetical protein
MFRARHVFGCQIAPLLALVAAATITANFEPRTAQSTTLPRPATDADDQATFGSSGVVPYCDIDVFAWTIGNRLARSAQPPRSAWQCLRDRGFTTIVIQNMDTVPTFERSTVEGLGMTWIDAYAIPDQTAYAPRQLQTLLNDVVTRLRVGEKILLHDAGGRGRLGFWETTFLLWDGWPAPNALNRYTALGWKINGVSDLGPGYECPDSTPDRDPGSAKGSNGQFQAMQAIVASLGQPPFDPSPDQYGNIWRGCDWPPYMADWDYSSMVWPPGGGQHWSLTGAVPGVEPRT